MIDLHCHVLPGIDDGPQTMEDALAIAHAAIATGTKTIIATPHVSWDYPENTASLIAERCARSTRCSWSSASTSRCCPVPRSRSRAPTRSPDAELRKLTLGGRAVAPRRAAADEQRGRAGRRVPRRRRPRLRVIVAHPERALLFHRDRDALRGLVEAGMLAQVTAGSIAGRFGKDVQRYALELVREGLAQNVASDAHSTGRRPATLGPELRRTRLAGARGLAHPGRPAGDPAGHGDSPAPELPPPPKRGLRRFFG